MRMPTPPGPSRVIGIWVPGPTATYETDDDANTKTWVDMASSVGRTDTCPYCSAEVEYREEGPGTWDYYTFRSDCTVCGWASSGDSLFGVSESLVLREFDISSADSLAELRALLKEPGYASVSSLRLKRSVGDADDISPQLLKELFDSAVGSLLPGLGIPESELYALQDVIATVDGLSPELIQYLKKHGDALEKLPWEVLEELVAEFLVALDGFQDVRLVGRDPSMRRTSLPCDTVEEWGLICVSSSR